MALYGFPVKWSLLLRTFEQSMPVCASAPRTFLTSSSYPYLHQPSWVISNTFRLASSLHLSQLANNGLLAEVYASRDVSRVSEQAIAEREGISDGGRI